MSHAHQRNRKIADLIKVLRQERRAVLSAQFTKLNELNEEKAHLLGLLAELMPLDEQSGVLQVEYENVDTLTRMAKDNQTLLRAAASGVESARGRLRELGRAPAQVGAYDDRGNALTLSESTVTQQKHV